jgi:phage shock protein PspC (stress-responsive transcriptional regulator)
MNDPQPPSPPEGPATAPVGGPPVGAPPVDAPSDAPSDAPNPTDPPPAGDQQGFFGAVRRLGVQRTDDRWVAGVCSGVAERFGIDPLVVRGLLGVALLLGGAGAVAYGIAWALLPERRDGRIHLEETIAGRFDVAIVGAAALVVLGAGRGSDAWGGGWGPGPHWVGNVLDAIGGLLWFGFIASLVVAAVVLVTRSQRDRAGSPGPTTPYGQPPYGQPPYGQPPQGQPPYARAPYARPPYGQPPYGQAPSGQPPYGQAPSGQPPYGQAP